MKTYEISGYVSRPNMPITSFSLTVNANDQTSARRLVTMQYGAAPDAKVTVQKLLEKKK
jgi:hypothetical protein